MDPHPCLLHGIDAIERLAAVSPATAAVMYSDYGDRQILTDAIVPVRGATC